MQLSQSAQAIQDFLAAKGIETKVIEFDASTRTAADAAAAVGCGVAQILKSIIFKSEQTGRPILVLASGVNRVNEAAIAQYLGEKLGKADADFVRAATGYAIGGVPPVGHRQPITTFIDEDLLAFDEIWAAAGTPHAVFRINPSLIPGLTGGSVVAVK